MSDDLDFITAGALLASKDALDTEALRLMYRLEVAGAEFYEGLAALVDDEAADLLRRNGREELGHARRIVRVLSLRTGEEYEPHGDDLVPLAVPLPPSADPELLPLVVAAELDGDAGYQRWADAEEDPEVERLLRLNGREETIHGERVQRVIALLGA
jgi:hypothetical protein